MLVGHPLTQVIGQSVSVPLQTMLPPHSGWPGSFAGLTLQVPILPARLQRSQLLLQALSQHTESAQNPVWHSPLAAQVSPLSLSMSHLPKMQNRPGAHCRLLVHIVGHDGLSPSQAYAAQVTAGVPSSRSTQMPGEPGLPQVSQAPLQALEQHAPATQAPELHSALAPQLVPLALSGAQSPAVHPVLELQVAHLAPKRPQVRLVLPVWH